MSTWKKITWMIAVLSFVLLPALAVLADEPIVPSLNLPCEIVDVYDGDTPTVELRIRIRVRMEDCWAPEMRGVQKPHGIISRDHLSKAALGKKGLLKVRLDGNVRSLGDLFSFDRIVGRIYVDHPQVDLSKFQVESGHASKTYKEWDPEAEFPLKVKSE